MTELPILGACLRVENIDLFRDWLTEAPRPLEIQGIAAPQFLDGDWKPKAAKARKAIEGLPGPVGTHGPAGDIMGMDDPQIQALAVKRLDQGLDLCAEIGTTHMVVHSPFTAWHDVNSVLFPDRRQERLDWLEASVIAAVRRAETLGVTLVIENIEDQDPSFRNEIVDQIGSAHFKVSIDTGHAFCAHKRTEAPAVDAFVRAAGDRLFHLHLQDTDGTCDRHWGVGQGDIPWRGVFDAIAALDVAPRLVFELRNKDDILPSAEYLVSRGFAR